MIVDVRSLSHRIYATCVWERIRLQIFAFVFSSFFSFSRFFFLFILVSRFFSFGRTELKVFFSMFFVSFGWKFPFAEIRSVSSIDRLTDSICVERARHSIRQFRILSYLLHFWQRIWCHWWIRKNERIFFWGKQSSNLPVIWVKRCAWSKLKIVKNTVFAESSFRFDRISERRQYLWRLLCHFDRKRSE